MRIAFFTDSYRPTRDGVASVVGDLAEQYTRAGHRVTVFAPSSDGAPAGTRVESGVEVVRVRGIPVPHYPEYRWAAFPFLALPGHRLAEADVVHIHTPGVLGSLGFLVGRRYGRPVVGTFHTNFAAMRASFPDRPSVRLFFRAAWYWALGTYYHADRTTAPSAEAAATITAATRKPFRAPVLVVPNGVDTSRFTPSADAARWTERLGSSGRPVVTYLGRLTSDKGVHRFLDAVAQLAPGSRALAVVGGTGPEADRIRARLRDDPNLAARTRFVGEVREEEKPGLYAASSLFILPSTSDTSSVALLEAMATGLPCLVSDRGGARELVRHGQTGLVTPVEPAAALARAIEAALDDPAGCRRVGQAARDWVVASASVAAASRQFISLYELLVDEKRHGAPHDA